MKKMKKVLALLLAVSMMLTYVPVPVLAEETAHIHDEQCGFVEETGSGCMYDQIQEEPDLPEEPACTGEADCSAEEHSENCEKKLADDQAAAKAAEEQAAVDAAAAEAVAALIAALPSLDEIKAKGKEAQAEDYNQVQAAYSGYENLTEDQKALLETTEEVFDAYFAYFSSLTEETNVLSGTCGANVTWSLDQTSDVMTISGTGDMTDYKDVFVPWYPYYQDDFTKLVIEQGVTSIGSYAFNHCSNLTEVEIADSVTRIGSFAFDACTKLTDIDIPDSVTTIGTSAFSSCSGLTSITIPDSVTAIGSDVFLLCKRLQSVTIPFVGESRKNANDSFQYPLGYIFGTSFYSDGVKVEQWYYGNSTSDIVTASFYLPPSLRKVTVTGGNIPYGAFSSCSMLTEINLPEDLTAIEGYAFYKCSGLTGVTIPAGVSDIGAYAFGSCAGLTDVYYGGTEVQWNQITIGNGNDDLQNAVIHYAKAPVGCKNGHTFNEEQICSVCGAIGGTCGETAEWGLSEDGTLSVSGTGSMESYSSYKNVPWYAYKDRIETVVIGAGITAIGNYAFYGCGNLAAVTLPASVKTIGMRAFSDCGNLRSINLPDGITSIGNYAFYGCAGLSEMDLPEGIDEIGLYAFSRCNGIKSIAIPAGITGFGEGVFSGCTGLESITFQEGITDLGNGTFSGCTGLTRVNIPGSITTIGYSVFSGCRNLKDITLSKGVASIGQAAFHGCSSLAGITLPHTVKSIGESAFQSCTGLKTITIPNSVTTVSGYAFYNCKNLESVVLSSGMTRIEQETFYGCSALKDVTIPNGVTLIGSDSFSGCSSLKRFRIPDTVTTIGSGVFNGCTSLEHITIPAGVTKIYEGTFFGCESLTGIGVDEKNTALSSDSRGVLFNKDKSTLIAAYPGIEDGYTIPASVTSIANFGFYACKNLKSMVIPSGVTTIGRYVFDGCSNLRTVTIPESVTKIGSSALGSIYGSGSGLTDIYYTGSATKWNRIEIENRIEIPANVTIHYNANLRSGTCGDNLRWNFESASGTLTISGQGAMWDFSQDGSNPAPWEFFGSTVRKLVVQEGVTEIGDFAFAGCSSVENASFPSTLTRVGEYAFYRFSRPNGQVYHRPFHTEINQTVRQWSQVQLETGNEGFPGAEITGFVNVSPVAASGKAGDNVYWEISEDSELVFFGTGDMYEFWAAGFAIAATSAKNVTISEGITNIGMNLFEGWGSEPSTQGFGSITVASTVKRVESMAFAGCKSLKTIVFTGDAPEFGDSCFRNVTATAYYPEGNATWTAARMQNYGGTITWVSRAGVHVHEFDAAHACKCGVFGGTCGENVTWLLDPETGLLHISGTGQMTGYPWADYKDRITSVIIDSGVTSIAAYAFRECINLRSVTIPKGIAKIGGSAFINCSSLNNVILPEGLAHIGEHAFRYCTSLSNVTIPDSVSTMERSVFFGCTSLRSVVLPKGITRIETEMFCNCSNLVSVSIPESVKSIGISAFNTCVNLENIMIPENVTSIDVAAFSGCSKLTSITIPSGITKISDSAFSSCRGITSIIIPDGVTDIGEYAFANCSNLENVSLPDSLKNVGTKAFQNCVRLNTVEIPDGVETIHENAFHNCQKLSEIKFCGNAPTIQSNAFGKVTATAFYPDNDSTWTTNVLQNYGGKITWKRYCIGEHRIEIDAAAAPTCSEDGLTEGKHCSVCGKVLVKQEVIPALGCSFTEYVPDRDATCVADGTKTAVCDRGCGNRDTVTVEGSLNPDAHSFGEWITDGSKSVRTCALCGYAEHKIITEEGDVEVEIPEQPDLDVEVDPVLPDEEQYLLVEEAFSGAEDYSVLKVFNISLKNSDGVHVQPDGSVKVKLPLDWSKQGNYKVYRVNDDGTLTDMNASRQGSHMVFDTDHFSLYVIAQEKPVIRLDADVFGDVSEVWVDGVAYPVEQGENGCCVRLPENAAVSSMITYGYHVGDPSDVHTQYPVSMKVWALEKQEDDSFSARRIDELDDILQYSGSSIRITGKKGIRMITSVEKAKKDAMISGYLGGYRLMEYGTVLALSSELEGGKPLTLGQSYARSNHAYKRNVADPVFAYSGDLVQYTNVLVGFTLEQCSEDIAMRSYMILEDENGNQITLYGGTVYRSIGYIASQNRTVFKPGTAAYDYVWEIIHHVYGNKFDAEYEG